MKIKRLVALALAGTMVFSMAACGDKKDNDSASETKKNVTTNNEETNKQETNKQETNKQEINSESTNNGADDVLVQKVLEAFAQYAENSEKNYSADMIMKIEMEASGMTMEIDSVQSSSSYDGVTYIKATSKVDMFGEKEESVDETYTITMEDGSVICATKSLDDDEWDVFPEIDLDEESETDIDVEELLETAQIEKKGDNYYVKISVDAGDMGLSEDDIMSGVSDAKVDVILTYNIDNEAITEIEIDMDWKLIEEAFASLFGEVEITELSMTIENIKKTDKPIEIPAEIELD